MGFWFPFSGCAPWLTPLPRSHPIAQGGNAIGFGGINVTDRRSGGGWASVPIDAGSRKIAVRNAQGAEVAEVMPPTVAPRGQSYAFRGTETAVVGSISCHKNNHRGAGSGTVAMPGLFPRMMDVKYGGSVEVGTCRTSFTAPFQSIGTQLGFDLYSRGGGLPIGWEGLLSDGEFTDSSVFDTTNVMIKALSGTCTTSLDEANRCIGPCDLAKTITEGVVGGLSVVLGAGLGFVGDFGLFAKFIGLEVAVGGATSIMDSAGSSSGTIAMNPSAKLLHARLTDTTTDGYLLQSDKTAFPDAVTAYLNFPSMTFGCASGKCDGANDAMLHTPGENPILSGGAESHSYSSSNDKWHGDVSMHRTMTVGGNLACHTASTGSGNFKSSIGSIPTSLFREISSVDRTAAFGIVDTNTMANVLGGETATLYTLLNGANKTASLFPTLGRKCSLCASLGTPGSTTAARDSECVIEGEADFGSRTVTYALNQEGGVGIDIEADDFFFPEGGDSLLDASSKICVYSAFDEQRATPLQCTDGTDDGVLDRLLGHVISPDGAARPVSNGPCIENNDLVELCSFDTTLHIRDSQDASCQAVPANWNTSCPSPRWSNDVRLVFPSRMSADDAALPRLTNDFDASGLYTSYCANSWGQTKDSPLPFADKSWFKSPIGDPDIPGAPSRGPVPTWLEDSQMYVYCAGDSLSVEERHEFCGGSVENKVPEGRGTYEGLRLENRQSLDQVCRSTGTDASPAQTCLLYVDDVSPFNPTQLQSVVDAFPSTDVEVVIVPASWSAVSMLSVFLAFVETVYYNGRGCLSFLEGAPPRR